MATPPPSHHCPGECGRKVPHTMVACRTCWTDLPTNLRHDVIHAYQVLRKDRGNTTFARQHRLSVAAALTWYRHHKEPRQ